jgi:hypothetical protein
MSLIDPQSTEEVSLEQVNKFIDIYEDQFLHKALGYGLFKAFKAGLQETTVEQKWKDLNEGAEFTYNSRLSKWNGFVTESKLSPIANYIFCEFMEDKIAENTPAGIVVPKTENSYREDGRQKIVMAWNEMVEYLYDLRKFLYTNQSVYTEWNSELSEIYYKKNVFSI